MKPKVSHREKLFRVALPIIFVSVTVKGRFFHNSFPAEELTDEGLVIGSDGTFFPVETVIKVFAEMT